MLIPHMSSRVLSIRLASAAILLISLLGCRSAGRAGTSPPDPTEGPIRLKAQCGFDAFLVHQGDVGIWTVKSFPIIESAGAPQIVALDDKGRCLIINGYSGTWTPTVAVQDREWLGGVAHADVDPRRPGRELYVGGKRGNLYQIWPHAQGGFDANIIAYLPGHEIHTLVADDLDPARPGIELVAFTRPGELYMLTPNGPGNSFETRHLQNLPGRVRDAVVLKGPDQQTLEVVTVSSAGTVDSLRFVDGKPEWITQLQLPMGLSRIAVRQTDNSVPQVLYVTADDGRIYRLERTVDRTFAYEIIFAGPQGPRGVVAGRFHQQPDLESIAIFGYSGKVQLLTRDQNGWRAEIIFEDIDKGHWLAAAELDGRNATDELILSGYGSRVVLLARPPGYGLNYALGPSYQSREHIKIRAPARSLYYSLMPHSTP